VNSSNQRPSPQEQLSAKRARLHPRSAEHEALSRLEQCDLLFFEPDNNHFAEVFGDIGTATDIAILVGGFDSDLAGYFTRSNLRDSAANLQNAAAALKGSTATIAWSGYDAPGLPSRMGLLRPLPGLRTRLADRAGRSLDEFLAGIRAQAPQARITVVGHSYGSVVVAHAVSQGTPVDDAVFVGSPGLGVAKAKLGGIRIWAARAPRDLVARFAWFVTNPAHPRFGIPNFRTNRAGATSVRGHSSYFSLSSQSLENIASIVTGRLQDVVYA
jgi:pimeloyl-ACP methyl ester carboxylesterase